MIEGLKVVNVAPISKAAYFEELTYFSSKDVSPGNLVVINLRNKDTLAIAISVVSAEDIKSQLRSSEFGFKKIKRVISDNPYSPRFLDAVRVSSDYFAAPFGQMINSLTPAPILSLWQRLNSENKESLWSVTQVGRGFEASVLGLPDEERYSYYRSMIREEFARKSSVLFIVPTIRDAEECGEILGRGIEEYSIIMHGKLTAKNIEERWSRALTENHPVLVVATVSFLSLPRKDISVMVVEKSTSQFYKTMNRPYFDTRKVAENLAQKISARLILGDSIPRVEDIYRSEEGISSHESPLKYRFPSNIRQELVDMRKVSDGHQIISPGARQAIQESLASRGHTIVICARKGLGTSTICSDCGEMVGCASCGLPMIIRRVRDENIFFCNRCGERSATDIVCSKCSSWKLKMLGIATERIEDEISRFIPKSKIFRMDGNLVKTSKQAGRVMEQFLDSPGSVLVGTEMVLGYLSGNIGTSIVVSLDTLFSLPDFRMNENIFNILMRLRSKTERDFIIQTRKPDEQVFRRVLDGDLLEFYRDEIDGRKKFGFPPFKLLIKITAEGPEQITNKEMGQLEGYLRNYAPSRFNAFIEKVRNKERVNILLRVDPKAWPPIRAESDQIEADGHYSNLLDLLRSLPTRFAVRVDPDNIL